jgi:uncharacterized protein (TIGR00288 family)
VTAIDNLSRRGTAGAYPEPLRHAPNAALLIDFDNVTMGIRSDLQVQLKRLLSSEVFKGKISVQRAYADWRRYPQYIVPLSEASIDLIFAPAFGSNKKNATDIRLAIDALELVFTRPEIGTFILLSGDSDFSSLVLKLKEYAKYVIGVGIRESSSDLLIQNCDEYFSYNELTGLLKEGAGEHQRRDPWELVVEALTRMQRAGDVMRSDRLKQVMQEIDPNFDEKDAGFSKYSKFMQEAARRGLMRLTKQENGQYEIGLGSNANVPPDMDRALAESPPTGPAAEPVPPRRRGERGDRGERAERGRGRGPTAAVAGMPLAQAFDLLRRALTELGATGDEATDADQTRERMVELADAPDPLFEPRRFHRFLRQAHDAGVVDLTKSGEGAYLVKLRPQPVGDTAGAVDAPASAPEVEGDEPHRHRRGERGGRGRRGGRRRDEKAGPGGPGPDEGAAGRAPAGGAPPVVTEAGPKQESRRNPRFRRGSRGGAAGPAAPHDGSPAPAEPRAEEVATGGPVVHNRSLRGRRGRRGGPGAPGDATPEPAAPARQVEQPAPVAREIPVARRVPEPPAARPVPQAPESQPAESDEAEGGSLFKRMSAALQRAMLGQPKDEPHDG